MRCKSTVFYAIDQIFLVLLRLKTALLHICMKRYIKYLGIAAIIIGLLLFVLHLIIRFNGNTLLFCGLSLVLGGVITFVKGESLTSFHSSNSKKKEQ